MFRSLAVVVLLLGCGASCPTPSSGACTCRLGPGPGVFGVVYVDRNGSDRSTRVQNFGFRDRALPEMRMDLFGAGRMLSSQETCSDGTYAFGRLQHGAYVVGVRTDRRAASKNHAPHALEALRRGEIRITTIGDSFPKDQADRLFPAVNAGLFERAGFSATNRNLAVRGTTAEEWLPDANRYWSRLEEALPETDVLVVSLGGNDVLGGIFEPFRYLDEDETSYREYAWTATEALSEAPAQIERALEHVRVIIETARERRPNMDVVWVLYPNLLRGKPWRDSLSVGANLFIPRLDEMLQEARRNAARDDVLLLDVYGLLEDQDDIDEYLHDTLHLNDAGHRLAGEELFRTLGGVLIDASHERVERSVGLVREADR